MVFGFVEILSLSSSFFWRGLIRGGALVRLHLPLALAMADLLSCAVGLLSLVLFLVFIGPAFSWYPRRSLHFLLHGGTMCCFSSVSGFCKELASLAQHPSHGRRRFGWSVRLVAVHLPKA